MIPRASEGQVTQIANALAKAEKPLLLIGSQAMLQERPMSDLMRAVESLGLPVFLSGMARGLLGKSHPLHMRHKRRLALKESDCVIWQSHSSTCDPNLHKPKQARLDPQSATDDWRNG
jgi:thiamine pyrophosphate-dependent acetolactate synthase large subunit-like protein